MNLSQVQLDELLVKLCAFLAEVVDDVLEVGDADVRPDTLEVSHGRMPRQGFDLFQVGNEDLQTFNIRSAAKARAKRRTSSPAARLTSKIHRELSKMSESCSAPSFWR